MRITLPVRFILVEQFFFHEKCVTNGEPVMSMKTTTSKCLSLRVHEVQASDDDRVTGP
jgi:hypothetical protein